jgi:DHA2 family multidrug resistance protein
LVAPFTNWILKTIGPRAMTGLGFAAAIYALYDMTSWTPDISVWPILTAGFALGLATSFISIPLATAGFATLPVELRSEAASLFALSRNLGSSVGISITAALLVANTQVNHAIISAAVTPFNRVLQSGAPLHFWNPSSPMGVQMLNQIVTRQSNIIAYVDNFKLMLVLVIVATPLALLIRNARPKPGAVTVVVD